MKILVVGASGFLGGKVYDFLKKNNTYEVLGTYCSNKKQGLYSLDITNFSNMKEFFSKEVFDVVIWLAGSKNLARCEQSIDYAKKLNFEPIKNLLQIFERLNKEPYLVYISTDYVFEGSGGDYTDICLPNPKTNYGASKALAEKEINMQYNNFAIIRTSAVMAKGGNFFEWIIRSLKEQKCIELYTNTYFTPTPAEYLIENLEYIMLKKYFGIFHICGNLKVNRLEFAQFLKSLSIDFKAKLKGIESTKDMLFQSDLSLVTSKIIKNEDLNFKKYIQKEVSGD